MIDISQIVSNTANAAKAAASTAEAARRAGADTGNGFGDALTRAREGSPQQTPSSKTRDAGAAQDKSASHKQAAPEPARADTKAPAAPADKPAAADKAKENDDSTVAADAAAAAAAAALALLLPATAPAASAAAGAAGAAVGSAADAGGSTALQAALAGAAQPAAADASDIASAQAQALRGNAALPDTLQVVTAEAAPAQPSVAATLATIASQRAAMHGSTPAATDARSGSALAQSVPAAGMPAQQDHTGQQPDSGIGRHRADPLAAANGAGEARPAASSFAAAQAAARATEAATVSANADNAPALAATLAGQHTTQAPAAAAAARPVVAPALYDSQWPQALGQQMIRLSTQGSQSAELQLNPPDLGPLKVVLNVVNDQAQAQFVSPHQAVRAAVEAALPHLRTALSENGIQLGQTSVGADGFANQAGNGQQQQQAPGNGRGQSAFGTATLAGTEAAAPAEPVVRSARVPARGEIDTFV
jgi:flagellar hook-length control protein FliK